MSSYAIIQLGGKQFRVSEGETLTVDHLDLSQDTTLTVTEVLLVKTDAALKIGQPFVAKAAVELELVTEQRGEKIDIFRYRAKSRHRRRKGHRQEESVMRVKKISL